MLPFHPSFFDTSGTTSSFNLAGSVLTTVYNTHTPTITPQPIAATDAPQDPYSYWTFLQGVEPSLQQQSAFFQAYAPGADTSADSPPFIDTRIDPAVRIDPSLRGNLHARAAAPLQYVKTLIERSQSAGRPVLFCFPQSSGQHSVETGESVDTALEGTVTLLLNDKATLSVLQTNAEYVQSLTDTHVTMLRELSLQDSVQVYSTPSTLQTVAYYPHQASSSSHHSLPPLHTYRSSPQMSIRAGSRISMPTLSQNPSNAQPQIRLSVLDPSPNGPPKFGFTEYYRLYPASVRHLSARFLPVFYLPPPPIPNEIMTPPPTIGHARGLQGFQPMSKFVCVMTPSMVRNYHLLHQSAMGLVEKLTSSMTRLDLSQRTELLREQLCAFALLRGKYREATVMAEAICVSHISQYKWEKAMLWFTLLLYHWTRVTTDRGEGGDATKGSMAQRYQVWSWMMDPQFVEQGQSGPEKLSALDRAASTRHRAKSTSDTTVYEAATADTPRRGGLRKPSSFAPDAPSGPPSVYEPALQGPLPYERESAQVPYEPPHEPHPSVVSIPALPLSPTPRGGLPMVYPYAMAAQQLQFLDAPTVTTLPTRIWQPPVLPQDQQLQQQQRMDTLLGPTPYSLTRKRLRTVSEIDPRISGTQASVFPSALLSGRPPPMVTTGAVLYTQLAGEPTAAVGSGMDVSGRSTKRPFFRNWRKKHKAQTYPAAQESTAIAAQDSYVGLNVRPRDGTIDSNLEEVSETAKKRSSSQKRKEGKEEYRRKKQIQKALQTLPRIPGWYDERRPGLNDGQPMSGADKRYLDLAEEHTSHRKGGTGVSAYQSRIYDEESFQRDLSDDEHEEEQVQGKKFRLRSIFKRKRKHIPSPSPAATYRPIANAQPFGWGCSMEDPESSELRIPAQQGAKDTPSQAPLRPIPLAAPQIQPPLAPPRSVVAGRSDAADIGWAGSTVPLPQPSTTGPTAVSTAGATAGATAADGYGRSMAFSNANQLDAEAALRNEAIYLEPELDTSAPLDVSGSSGEMDEAYWSTHRRGLTSQEALHSSDGSTVPDLEHPLSAVGRGGAAIRSTKQKLLRESSLKDSVTGLTVDWDASEGVPTDHAQAYLSDAQTVHTGMAAYGVLEGSGSVEFLEMEDLPDGRALEDDAEERQIKREVYWNMSDTMELYGDAISLDRYPSSATSGTSAHSIRPRLEDRLAAPSPHDIALPTHALHPSYPLQSFAKTAPPLYLQEYTPPPAVANALFGSVFLNFSNFSPFQPLAAALSQFATIGKWFQTPDTTKMHPLLRLLICIFTSTTPPLDTVYGKGIYGTLTIPEQNKENLYEEYYHYGRNVAYKRYLTILGQFGERSGAIATLLHLLPRRWFLPLELARTNAADLSATYFPSLERNFYSSYSMGTNTGPGKETLFLPPFFAKPVTSALHDAERKIHSTFPSKFPIVMEPSLPQPVPSPTNILTVLCSLLTLYYRSGSWADVALLVNLLLPNISLLRFEVVPRVVPDDVSSTGGVSAGYHTDRPIHSQKSFRATLQGRLKHRYPKVDTRFHKVGSGSSVEAPLYLHELRTSQTRSTPVTSAMLAPNPPSMDSVTPTVTAVPLSASAKSKIGRKSSASSTTKDARARAGRGSYIEAVGISLALASAFVLTTDAEGVLLPLRPEACSDVILALYASGCLHAEAPKAPSKQRSRGRSHKSFGHTTTTHGPSISTPNMLSAAATGTGTGLAATPPPLQGGTSYASGANASPLAGVQATVPMTTATGVTQPGSMLTGDGFGSATSGGTNFLGLAAPASTVSGAASAAASVRTTPPSLYPPRQVEASPPSPPQDTTASLLNPTAVGSGATGSPVPVFTTDSLSQTRHQPPYSSTAYTGGTSQYATPESPLPESTPLPSPSPSTDRIDRMISESGTGGGESGSGSGAGSVPVTDSYPEPYLWTVLRGYHVTVSVNPLGMQVAIKWLRTLYHSMNCLQALQSATLLLSLCQLLQPPPTRTRKSSSEKDSSGKRSKSSSGQTRASGKATASPSLAKDSPVSVTGSLTGSGSSTRHLRESPNPRRSREGGVGGKLLGSAAAVGASAFKGLAPSNPVTLGDASFSSHKYSSLLFWEGKLQYFRGKLWAFYCRVPAGANPPVHEAKTVSLLLLAPVTSAALGLTCPPGMLSPHESVSITSPLTTLTRNLPLGLRKSYTEYLEASVTAFRDAYTIGKKLQNDLLVWKATRQMVAVELEAVLWHNQGLSAIQRTLDVSASLTGSRIGEDGDSGGTGTGAGAGAVVGQAGDALSRAKEQDWSAEAESATQRVVPEAPEPARPEVQPALGVSRKTPMRQQTGLVGQPNGNGSWTPAAVDGASVLSGTVRVRDTQGEITEPRQEGHLEVTFSKPPTADSATAATQQALAVTRFDVDWETGVEVTFPSVAALGSGNGDGFGHGLDSRIDKPLDRDKIAGSGSSSARIRDLTREILGSRGSRRPGNGILANGTGSVHTATYASPTATQTPRTPRTPRIPRTPGSQPNTPTGSEATDPNPPSHADIEHELWEKYLPFLETPTYLALKLCSTFPHPLHLIQMYQIFAEVLYLRAKYTLASHLLRCAHPIPQQMMTPTATPLTTASASPTSPVSTYRTEDRAQQVGGKGSSPVLIGVPGMEYWNEQFEKSYKYWRLAVRMFLTYYCDGKKLLTYPSSSFQSIEKTHTLFTSLVRYLSILPAEIASRHVGLLELYLQSTYHRSGSLSSLSPPIPAVVTGRRVIENWCRDIHLSGNVISTVFSPFFPYSHPLETSQKDNAPREDLWGANFLHFGGGSSAKKAAAGGGGATTAGASGSYPPAASSGATMSPPLRDDYDAIGRPKKEKFSALFPDKIRSIVTAPAGAVKSVVHGAGGPRIAPRDRAGATGGQRQTAGETSGGDYYTTTAGVGGIPPPTQWADATTGLDSKHEQTHHREPPHPLHALYSRVPAPMFPIPGTCSIVREKVYPNPIPAAERSIMRYVDSLSGKDLLECVFAPGAGSVVPESSGKASDGSGVGNTIETVRSKQFLCSTMLETGEILEEESPGVGSDAEKNHSKNQAVLQRLVPNTHKSGINALFHRYLYEMTWEEKLNQLQGKEIVRRFLDTDPTIVASAAQFAQPSVPQGTIGRGTAASQATGTETSDEMAPDWLDIQQLRSQFEVAKSVPPEFDLHTLYNQYEALVQASEALGSSKTPTSVPFSSSSAYGTEGDVRYGTNAHGDTFVTQKLPASGSGATSISRNLNTVLKRSSLAVKVLSTLEYLRSTYSSLADGRIDSLAANVLVLSETRSLIQVLETYRNTLLAEETIYFTWEMHASKGPVLKLEDPKTPWKQQPQHTGQADGGFGHLLSSDFKKTLYLSPSKLGEHDGQHAQSVGKSISEASSGSLAHAIHSTDIAAFAEVPRPSETKSSEPPSLAPPPYTERSAHFSYKNFIRSMVDLSHQSHLPLAVRQKALQVASLCKSMVYSLALGSDVLFLFSPHFAEKHVHIIGSEASWGWIGGSIPAADIPLFILAQSSQHLARPLESGGLSHTPLHQSHDDVESALANSVTYAPPLSSSCRQYVAESIVGLLTTTRPGASGVVTLADRLAETKTTLQAFQEVALGRPLHFLTRVVFSLMAEGVSPVSYFPVEALVSSGGEIPAWDTRTPTFSPPLVLACDTKTALYPWEAMIHLLPMDPPLHPMPDRKVQETLVNYPNSGM